MDFAERKNATPAQISLAWEITQKPYVIPIPGTTKMERVRENFGGVDVDLTAEEMAQINEALSHMELLNMGRG